MKTHIEVSSDIQNIDKTKWSNFVLSHVNGNIYQTPEMYMACKNSRLFIPLVISVKKGNEIIGVLLTNIKKQFSGVLGRFTLRSIVLGGPILCDNDSIILDVILKHYNKLIGNKVIYSQFTNLFTINGLKDVFVENGYAYEDRLNIIVNLNKSEDDIWSDINKKAKNRIRAGIRKGTKIAVENNLTTLEQCYKILKDAYIQLELPLASYDYFISLFKSFNSSDAKFIIFTAKYENEIIGFMFTTGYRETLFGLYNGMRKEFSDKCPNDLLPWEIFKWAKSNGYKKFDWLGAGKPDEKYSVRDYKIKFGGDLINLGRFVKIHKPLFYNIGKTGLKYYKYIKR